MGGIPGFNYESNWVGFGPYAPIAKSFFTALNELGISDAIEEKWKEAMEKYGIKNTSSVDDILNREGQAKTTVEGSWYEYLLFGLIIAAVIYGGGKRLFK